MKTLIDRHFIAPVPVAIAWQHVAKVEQWVSWAKHIKRIELQSDDGLNKMSQGEIILQNGIKTTFTMREFKPMENWKWVGSFLWLNVHYDHSFHPINEDNCEIIFHVGAKGFGVSLIGYIFAIIYNRNLDIAIPNLIQELNIYNQ